MLNLRRGLLGLVLTAGLALGLASSASASPSHKCGDVHVSQLRPNGYTSEHLVVSPRVLSCAQGRRLVTSYYTSHEEGKGSGAFRKLGAYNCGGGLSSLRGGVALLCDVVSHESDVVLELRVKPLPPPPSLCKTTVAYHNISAAIITKYENVSCRLARQVAYASAFQDNQSPDGFSCSQVPNSEASFRCVSGSRLVEYYAT
jgi:hypothetical protein